MGMQNVVTADLLLKGSRNIDRMRTEIKQITSLLHGLVEEEPPKEDTKGIFDSPSMRCRWVIRWEEGSLSIECHRAVGMSYDLVLLKSKYGIPLTLKGSDVQFVYSNLKTLIDGTVDLFPQIERLWHFLLDASEYFDVAA